MEWRWGLAFGLSSLEIDFRTGVSSPTFPALSISCARTATTREAAQSISSLRVLEMQFKCLGRVRSPVSLCRIGFQPPAQR